MTNIYMDQDHLLLTSELLNTRLHLFIETAKLYNPKAYDYFEYLLSVLTKIDINDDEKLEEIIIWSKSLPEKYI